MFDEVGTVGEVVRMAPYPAGRFFYRMPEGVFHGLVFRSPWFVFLEITRGPFDPSDSEPAPWAPAESDPAAGAAYATSLAARAAAEVR